MNWVVSKLSEMRIMICPYCRYSCQSSCLDAVYCGPHLACFGGNIFPSVQMVEKFSVVFDVPPKEIEAGRIK